MQYPNIFHHIYIKYNNEINQIYFDFGWLIKNCDGSVRQFTFTSEKNKTINQKRKCISVVEMQK